MTNKKKMALAGALILVMVVSAIGGTLAYLTDSSHLDNVFLVGAFTQPTDPKPNPDPPGPDPDDPDPKPVDPRDFGDPDGFIFEPYWNLNGLDSYNKEGGGTALGDKHRLGAGTATTKDPYIGIGKESESGYVLACVTNPMGDNVYFTLSEGWAPVTGCVREVDTTAAGKGAPANVASGTKFYSKGLFKWVGANADKSLKALTPDGTADVWTDTPVFSYVYTATEGMTGVQALAAGDRKMTVWAYIGQASGKQNENTALDITAQYVEDQAKAWATSTEAGYPALDVAS